MAPLVSRPDNPLIVQGDLTVLVEVDSPRYTEARDGLVRQEETLMLLADSTLLADELAANRTLAPWLGRRSGAAFVIAPEARGVIKQALLKSNFPVEDLVGYTEGEQLLITLREHTCTGVPFALRPYQQDVADVFHAAGSVRGGSGIIVLPCGAGKTIVGMACMAAVQALVRALYAHPSGVPLSTLANEWRGAKEERRLAMAMHTGLAHFVMFATLRPSDHALMVTLWPSVAREVTRVAPSPPSPVVPEERVHAAVLVEDMTTCLAAAAVEPLPIRAQDAALFARTQRAIEAQLAPLPEWLARSCSMTSAERVSGAVAALTRLDMVRVVSKGSHGAKGAAWLHPTASGATWLARPLPERMAAVLDAVRGSAEQTPSQWYGAGPHAGISFFGGGWTAPIYEMRELDLRGPLTRAGLLPDRRLTFAVTDIGRYLLGAGSTFTYHADVQGAVVVQPNFDIVFLAPAPLLEGRIAWFAERTGEQTGVLFRLTRESVLSAAEGGMRAEEMLDVLRGVASKPVPENVVIQLQSWVGATRCVMLRTAMLLECPDPETTAQVRTMLRGTARVVTETILEIVEVPDKGTIRRLRQAGAFVKEG